MISRNKYDAGYEAAMRHIEEARAFSRELGGSDTDVKEYFFSLRGHKLETILVEYGHNHGKVAESYARMTMSDWRTGATKMSGTVAKRLFDLLPPRMPLKKKYELAENIWRHFGPSSSHSYVVGPNADVSEIANAVADRLDEVVTKYSIPENLQNRFNWLAAGDIKLKEQLLNHFRQVEKALAMEKVNAEVPVLQRQVRNHGDVTGRARSIIQVHRHEVSVWVDALLDNKVKEETPISKVESSSERKSWLWIFFIITGLILFVLLLR